MEITLEPLEGAMYREDEISDTAWHLDKRIPVGLMLGLAINLGVSIWYASKLDSRVTYIENEESRSARMTDKMHMDLERLQDNDSGLNTRMTRVEDHSESILDIVKELKARRDPFPGDAATPKK